jgi:L-iditol 2-dehydrogenase
MKVENRKLLLVEPNNLVLTHEVFNDSPEKPDEVVVKVTSSGICGSDLHYFKHGGLGTVSSPMPMHQGHEAAGIIVSSSDPLLREGDQVAIEPGLTCGACGYCISNRSNLCPDVKFLGSNAAGAQSDYLRVDSSTVIPIAGLQPSVLALFEPFTVGLHNAELGIKLLSIKGYSRISIIGGGTIGCMTALACSRLFPQSEIFVIEKSLQRQISARELLHPKVEVLSFSDMSSLGKNSCNLIYDVVGTQETFALAQELAAAGGVVILVGIPEIDHLEINPHRSRVREIIYIFSRRSAVNLSLAKDLFRDFEDELRNLKIESFLPEEGTRAYSHALQWEKNTQRVQISWSNK